MEVGATVKSNGRNSRLPVIRISQLIVGHGIFRGDSGGERRATQQNRDIQSIIDARTHTDLNNYCSL